MSKDQMKQEKVFSPVALIILKVIKSWVFLF